MRGVSIVSIVRAGSAGRRAQGRGVKGEGHKQLFKVRIYFLCYELTR
jgi:hypothetical protein